jgi:hypothetical protein
MRFGIGMNTDHTLEEVGQQFSVTRERIRQIEAKALRKLKHPRAGSCGASWISEFASVVAKEADEVKVLPRLPSWISEFQNEWNPLGVWSVPSKIHRFRSLR